jgi:hypothetical protein
MVTLVNKYAHRALVLLDGEVIIDIPVKKLFSRHVEILENIVSIPLNILLLSTCLWKEFNIPFLFSCDKFTRIFMEGESIENSRNKNNDN